MLWVDPASIAAGRLTDLALPSRRAIRPRGVLLSSYARLKLQLADRGLRRALLRLRLAARHRRDRCGARGRTSRAGRPAGADRPQHGRTGRAHRDQALAETVGTPAHHAGSSQRRLLRARARAARHLSLRAEAVAARSASIRRTIWPPRCSAAFPGSITCCRRSGDRAPPIDLLDPSSWPSDGSEAEAGAARARHAKPGADMAEPDGRMAQIVGVNRQTVVRCVARRPDSSMARRHTATGPCRSRWRKCPGSRPSIAEESHGNLASNPRIIDAIVDLSAPAPPAGSRRLLRAETRVTAHRRCATARGRRGEDRLAPARFGAARGGDCRSRRAGRAHARLSRLAGLARAQPRRLQRHGPRRRGGFSPKCDVLPEARRAICRSFHICRRRNPRQYHVAIGFAGQ